MPSETRTGFTKGPWYADRQYIRQEDSDAIVARVDDGGRVDGEELIPPNEQENNALLLAAAPDLLEALKACQEHVGLVRLQRGFDIEVVRKQVAAALAKAESR